MLTARRAVIVVAFSVELRSFFRETRRDVGHYRDQLRGFTTRFSGTRIAGCLQALHPLLIGDRAHAFAACFAEIEC